MNKQYGLSLIELMISIALGLFLMAGVLQMFLSTKSSFNTQQGLSRIQETGRLAMEFIGRDMRMAASMGCVRLFNPTTGIANVTNPLNLAKAGLHKNFSEGLRGYNKSSDLGGAAVVLSALGTSEAVDDSDVLIIRGATEHGFPVAAVNTKSTVFGYIPNGIAKVNNCVDGLCVGDIAVVSDCDNGRIFEVNDVSAATNLLTVKHNENWDITSTTADVYEARPEVFIYPLRTIVYFVAKGVSGEPSLFQRIDTQVPQELVQGVEKLRITYSSDKSIYKRANDVGAGNWNGIIAVKLEFVVRGLEDNVLEKTQKYAFTGDTPVDPGDRRIRQVFNSVFAVRTRIN